MMDITIPKSVFEQLSDSEFQFMLTGSRYFNNMKYSSDWDFFTQYNERVMKFLASIGFKEISSDKYGDSNCTSVMRAYTWDNRQIDIQLVIDVNLKARVQESFKRMELLSPNQDEWNLAFKLMQDLQVA